MVASYPRTGVHRLICTWLIPGFGDLGAVKEVTVVFVISQIFVGITVAFVAQLQLIIKFSPDQLHPSALLLVSNVAPRGLSPLVPRLGFYCLA